jgi:hypothetical protein
VFVLPVSRTPVTLRVPSGHDEVFLAESAGGGVGLRIEVVRRLAPPAREDWHALPYVDVDAALLALRQFLAGDRLVAEFRCAACGDWLDATLSIDQYLKANRPRAVRATLPVITPTAGRVLVAVEELGPAAAESALAAESLKDCSPRDARRALALLEKVAPPLSGPVDGACSQCGAAVSAWFDPGGFVIAELRARAVMVFEEVHLLASRYGWTEDSIHSMPGRRRAAYAGLVAMGANAR